MADLGSGIMPGERSWFAVMQSVRNRLSVMLGSLQNARVPVPGCCAHDVGLWLSKAECRCLSCLGGVKDFAAHVFGLIAVINELNYTLKNILNRKKKVKSILKISTVHK